MIHYDSRGVCRRCLNDDVSIEQLRAYLDDYAASLPDALRVDARTYRQRLEICAQCDQLVEFTCRLCGCYVQARAAKRALHCPFPYAPKWSAAHNPDETP